MGSHQNQGQSSYVQAPRRPHRRPRSGAWQHRLTRRPVGALLRACARSGTVRERMAGAGLFPVASGLSPVRWARRGRGVWLVCAQRAAARAGAVRRGAGFATCC